MDDYNYTWIIIGTTVGFFALAAALLVPIYRFLKREEKESEAWTSETIKNAGRKNGQHD